MGQVWAAVLLLQFWVEFCSGCISKNCGEDKGKLLHDFLYVCNADMYVYSAYKMTTFVNTPLLFFSVQQHLPEMRSKVSEILIYKSLRLSVCLFVCLFVCLSVRTSPPRRLVRS